MFKQELGRHHITSLKQISVTNEYDEEKAAKGIDFEAFKNFMKRYIQKWKGETCWVILKYYGYDSNLQLKKQLIDDKSISPDDLRDARSFELT